MMNLWLLAAAASALAIGFAHSVLGERYILMRLFRRSDLPELFGSDAFTRRTLRFAWHLTTVAWCGFAALMLLLAQNALTFHGVTRVIALTFLATSVVTFIGSRGRHFAWPVFLFIAWACWIVTLA